MILVMEPMTIVGAAAGGFLNKLLPLWLTTLLLCLLLIVMARKLWQKTISMYHLESAAGNLASGEHLTVSSSIQEDADVRSHLSDLISALHHADQRSFFRIAWNL